MNGNFIKRLTTGGPLNAPWAMIKAPSSFGAFGGDLLVGNLGDGHINAFNASTGAFIGALQDSTGAALSIEALWGLSFGAAASGATVAGRLYFAAGIQAETHGLFGYLAPALVPGQPPCDNLSKGVNFWRQACISPRDDDDDDAVATGAALTRAHNNGRGRGHDEDDDHDRHRHGKHGLSSGVSADSLNALLGCVSTGPGAFGGEGCFTAGCDLLNTLRHRTDRDLAAQQLLALRLNLCAGLVCTDLLIGCSGETGNLQRGPGRGLAGRPALRRWQHHQSACDDGAGRLRQQRPQRERRRRR